MVHVGFAISVVDEEEAARTYSLLQTMGMLADELGPDGTDEVSETVETMNNISAS
jgi:hypothetical protein